MKKIFKADIIGFIFVSILGTLSHFLYELLGESRLVALFCPVNESVWEHLKLLYFPFLFYIIFEYFVLNKPEGFFFSRLNGVFCGMIFMVSFFYTYSGILGYNVLIVDILTFIISVMIAFFISNTMLTNKKTIPKLTDNLSIILLIVISALFFVFTFSPPFISVFKDSIAGTYGI